MPKPIGIGNLKTRRIKKILRRKNITPLKRPLETPIVQNLPSPNFTTDTNNNEEGQLSVDVYQTKTEIIVLAPIAGVQSEDIKITITDDVLSIQGKRKFQPSISPQDYFTQECFWGNFSRSIVLPQPIDINRVKSRFEKSILEIKLPKINPIRTRVIQIKN